MYHLRGKGGGGIKSIIIGWACFELLPEPVVERTPYKQAQSALPILCEPNCVLPQYPEHLINKNKYYSINFFIDIKIVKILPTRNLDIESSRCWEINAVIRLR